MESWSNLFIEIVIKNYIYESQRPYEFSLMYSKPEDSVKDIINAMTAEYEGITIIAKDGI